MPLYHTYKNLLNPNQASDISTIQQMINLKGNHNVAILVHFPPFCLVNDIFPILNVGKCQRVISSNCERKIRRLVKNRLVCFDMFAVIKSISIMFV